MSSPTTFGTSGGSRSPSINSSHNTGSNEKTPLLHHDGDNESSSPTSSLHFGASNDSANPLFYNHSEVYQEHSAIINDNSGSNSFHSITPTSYVLFGSEMAGKTLTAACFFQVIADAIAHGLVWANNGLGVADKNLLYFLGGNLVVGIALNTIANRKDIFKNVDCEKIFSSIFAAFAVLAIDYAIFAEPTVGAEYCFIVGLSIFTLLNTVGLFKECRNIIPRQHQYVSINTESDTLKALKIARPLTGILKLVAAIANLTMLVVDKEGTKLEQEVTALLSTGFAALELFSYLVVFGSEHFHPKITPTHGAGINEVDENNV
jgi:hypothetical protein